MVNEQRSRAGRLKTPRSFRISFAASGKLLIGRQLRHPSKPLKMTIRGMQYLDADWQPFRPSRV
jgi:hypothetical protein